MFLFILSKIISSKLEVLHWGFIQAQEVYRKDSMLFCKYPNPIQKLSFIICIYSCFSGQFINFISILLSLLFYGLLCHVDPTPIPSNTKTQIGNWQYGIVFYNNICSWMSIVVFSCGRALCAGDVFPLVYSTKNSIAITNKCHKMFIN